MATDPRQPADAEASATLVTAAQAGDEQALDDLMRLHLPGLRAFIRARSSPELRRREAESDLVQTVCREALAHLSNYEWRGEGTFRWWLFSVALNKLKRKWAHHMAAKRSPNRERELASQASLATVYRSMCGPSQEAIAAELILAVEAALDRMPEPYREAILMARIAGMSTAEMAKELDRTEAAARMLLGRALTRLAREIDGAAPPEG